jgi:hypothetical protein
MDLDRSSRTLLGVAFGGLGSLAVAGGLVGVRGEISNVNVALVLALVVLGGACFGGRTAGVMSALVAATAFDFFHTRPYGLLKIADVNDAVTTVLLLVVGLVMGEAVERSSRFRDRLHDDQAQLRRLHRVAAMAASGAQDEQTLVDSVAGELTDTLGLVGCRFEHPPFLTELPHLELDGAIPGTRGGFRRRAYRLPGAGVDLRVVGQRGVVGRFVLAPAPGAAVSAERLLVAVSLVHALGLALTPVAPG